MDPGIPIGEKGDIQCRTKCPFCRFVASSIRTSDDAGASEFSLCFVTLKFVTKFWLTIQRPDQPEPDTLTGYSEKIVLVSSSLQAAATTGRRVESHGLDYSLVRRWLELCEMHHKDVCPVSDRSRLDRSHAPRTLRVVDTWAECLVEIPWTDRYVALNYVWAEANPLKLYSHDLKQLYTAWSLKHMRRSMPATIQDAMSFTTGIGVRCLWFDSLCLVGELMVMNFSLRQC